MHRRSAIFLTIFAVSFALYWPVRNHDFIYYDDPQFITENEMVKAGLTAGGVVYAFSNPVVGNWHPITTLSHMLDCELFGVNPGMHHLMNACLHALNASLVFYVLLKLTGRLWESLVVALVFALHPLRVESVAWVSERKDVLCWLFGLLALLAYTKYARLRDLEAVKGPGGTSSGWNFVRYPAYWLTVLCFALALMSKAMLVTFPFLLLLLDLWPLRRMPTVSSYFRPGSVKTLWLEKLPLFVVTVVFSLVTLHVQASAGAMTFIAPISFVERLSNAISSYAKYIVKFFWPVDLAVIYPHPSAPYAASERWAVWQIILVTLFLIAISWLCIRQTIRRPYLVVGWLWFLGAMVPVIGVVQVGEQAMADRYSYIPTIGLALILVWGAAELAARYKLERPLLTFFSAIICLLLCFATSRQLTHWKDTISLFSWNVRVSPANPSAFFAWGVGLEKNGQIAAAIEKYRQALAIYPLYQKAHYNLGQIFRKQGRWHEAAASYRAALEISPDDLSARLNLASVINQLGQSSAAINEYEIVLAHSPDSFEALNNLAWILASASDTTLRDGIRAVRLAEKANDLTGHSIAVFIGTLAAAYAEAGRFDDAILAAQRAIQLAADSGLVEIANRNQTLLQLYRAGKPYRESKTD